MSSIGIFGGSFNPVHFGHLMIAECAREQFKLDKVIFIPNGNPPHKTKKDLASGEDRFNMLKLATSDNPYFEVSDIEIKSEEYCYTCDTMPKLAQIYPEDKLFFIMGEDSALYFEQWNKPEIIASYATLLIASRFNEFDEALLNACESIKRNLNAEIELITSPLMVVSSSSIRGSLKKGVSVRYQIPDTVIEYVKYNKLYL